MHYAACACTGYPRASSAIAAELLALAERIVPLEREPTDDRSTPIWARWDERRRIREVLAAEANVAWLHPEKTITTETP
jgi:hypothetical protein